MSLNKVERNIIYQGKAKILYSCSNPSNLIQYFKDDATANNAEKHSIILSKGIINNFISEYLMKSLEIKGIPTHFIKRLNEREQLIKKVKIIPVELVVRNLAAGSIIKRYGINEGIKFSEPLIEFFYKNDSLNDPLLNEQHIEEFGWSDNNEIKLMKKEALRINKILIKIFDNAGIDLVDFKIEFGHCFNKKNEKQIILADEISPDNCRLWDKETKKILDKDIFRKNLGNLISGYQEVADRLGVKIN